MKGHMESDGFHPHTEYKGVRKSRDQKVKTEGIRMKRTNVSSIKAGDKCFCGRTSVKGGLCPSCRDNGVFFEKQKIEQAQRNPKNIGRMERKERVVAITDMDDFTLDLRIESLQDEVQRRTALEQTGVPNSDIEKIKKMLMTAQLEKRKRVANPETQSQLSEHIVQIINKTLLPSKLTFPYKTSNIRGIEKKSSNKWIFTVIMQSRDEQTVKEIEGAGFKAIEINDIMDTRHATFEGDLGLG